MEGSGSKAGRAGERAVVLLATGRRGERRMKPDSVNPPRRQTGFTLLELLVVVAVLGLLIIGLTQGVRAGLTLWDAQSRRTGETAELDAAARVLRRTS